ncbi:hypothetical protein [uncultured Parabacteroides sp.]|uniref:hypothetical protein n=1 Tax=uncultured Parabacteroides sp. TaxID=512312 RepID=UPI00265807FB|nr:hypothetical protein [uncultured Parabacteroides sp.]
MVDVRELKIGNYVYLQSSKTPYRITEIGYSEIEYPRYEASGISSGAVFRTYVENLNPIPLTEELLLKCGFEKVLGQQLFGFPQENFYRKFYEIKTSKCPLVMIKENGYLCHVVSSDGEFGCSFIPILYIHQFQNLYYSLSGKELEVNFP